MNSKFFEWAGVKVMLAGKEVDVKPMEYEEQKSNLGTISCSVALNDFMHPIPDTLPLDSEFYLYLRRGSFVYIRNNSGVRLKLPNDGILKTLKLNTKLTMD